MRPRAEPVAATDPLRAAAAYHQEIATRLRAIVRDELVGVYAGGSYALGGYTPGRSDLDVAAVCRQPLARARKLDLAEALRHESLPCPARGLELVLYSESTVREPSAEAGYELDLNSGSAMPYRFSVDPSDAPGHWYVIDRAILRDHGHALVGPLPRDLFAPIPRETLIRLLSESVRWHREQDVPRADDAVLNACRAWRYAAEGVWSSKAGAGEWAHARLRDSGLISDALAVRLDKGQRDETQLNPDRVEAFLGSVQAFLDGAGTSPR